MHVKKANLLAIIAAIITLDSATGSAQTVTTLHSFNGTDGLLPDAALVQGTDGNFYGTTAAGGAHHQGTVFKIDSAGNLTTLHSFSGFPLDGAAPTAGLVQGADGNFYGTTASGGMFFQGTVFRMTPAGMLLVMHSFNGFMGEGAIPAAGLVQGSDANFYGTTVSGGAHYKGTVFKITSLGALTTLHSFGDVSGDGVKPTAGLVQGTDGNFYGTTASGGTHYQGTAFQITPAGAVSVLHSFSASTTEGAVPVAGLVQGSDGNFYGTTAIGGMHYQGTVFNVDSMGNFTTLHSLTGYPNEGAGPVAGLMQGSDGNFYGTTAAGGIHYQGTAFKITPTGNLTTLHSFSGSPSEGAGPVAGLVQGSDGNFYGTTALGGTHGVGTVFSLSTSAAPPAL
jgi:uncharacterized repeat protein (TIGR03803 family)